MLCVAESGYGRTYPLHDERPGPQTNINLSGTRSDVIGSNGLVLEVGQIASSEGALTRVDIRGAIEQRAGYHDICGGWSDGHDAIADRLCAALVEGDVLLVVDSPGGAHAGLQEAVRRVLEVKQQYGRQITGFPDEMAGSAAVWWMLAVCNYVWAPVTALFGSIGAYGAHTSISGALAMEGVSVTYFAAPGPGKVAGAPELPLSDEAIVRGQRDVGIACDAFIAAVCASPVGIRHVLTDEYIRTLDGDVLPGELAVAAGLVDGISTLEEVTASALAQAKASFVATNDGLNTRPGADNMALRAEAPKGDKKPGGDEPDGDEMGNGGAGKVPSDCSTCGLKNEMDAKFCKGCGTTMASKPMAETEEAAPPPPAGPPKLPAAPPGKPPSPTPPPAATAATAPIAEQLGLRSAASTPAIKGEIARLQRIAASAVKWTGKRDAEEIEGQLQGMHEECVASGALKIAADAAIKREEWRDRTELVAKLEKIGARTSDDLYTHLDDKGEPVVDANGKATRRIRDEYVTMPIGTLRGLVERKSALAPAATRSPFEPNRTAATEARAAGDVESAKTAKAVQLAVKSGIDPKVAAESYARLFPVGGPS